MQNTVENTLDKIKRTGFSVETNILSENDIKILTEECKKILLNDKKDIELKFNNNNFKKYNISETIQTNYNTKRHRCSRPRNKQSKRRNHLTARTNC